MSALHVLHVTPYAPEAWAYGGIPRVVGAVTHALAARGHRVTVCATDVCSREARLRPGSDQGSVGPRRRSRWSSWSWTAPDGVTTRVFPNLSNRLAYEQLFTPLGLGPFLRRRAESFDVAHLHACRNLPVTVAAGCLDRAGVPFVLSPNGTAPRIERRRLGKRAFDLVFGQTVVRRASAVLAVSEAERRQLLDLGIHPDRIETVPNAIDLHEFANPVPRGRFRARLQCGRAPVVLFLGKLTPRKRVEQLVEAVAMLGRDDVRMVVAGNDMGARSSIRVVARQQGLGDRTIFTGLLTGKERLEALTDADLVAYPSDHEVFGLVPMEALLCGTPVVVSDDSGCGEIVSEVGGGQVVPLGDIQALAGALRMLLEAPDLWRERAVGAAVRIRHRFGQDVVATRLEDLYRRLLRQPQDAHPVVPTPASPHVEELR